MNGEEYYVGCLPISTFGKLGDIVEFTFTDNSSIKVLCIDAKSNHDRVGEGSTGQTNTPYCHGVLDGDALKLSAIELWCGGNSTGAAAKPNILNKNVSSAKIIAHSNIFD